VRKINELGKVKNFQGFSGAFGAGRSFDKQENKSEREREKQNIFMRVTGVHL
jgi:hypothetical protein